MKNLTTYFILFFLSATTISCTGDQQEEPSPKYNFSKHEVKPNLLSQLEKGSTYLSVYSEIYSNTEKRTHSLTVTVSIRNTSNTKDIYIAKADYYDTHGELMTSYIKNPIKVIPLETIEIVIDKSQTHGGTGGNFIFEWAKDSTASNPIFEGVMISTSGQQGISFTTQGITL
jgi:hypothetical protein